MIITKGYIPNITFNINQAIYLADFLNQHMNSALIKTQENEPYFFIAFTIHDQFNSHTVCLIQAYHSDETDTCRIFPYSNYFWLMYYNDEYKYCIYNPSSFFLDYWNGKITEIFSDYTIFNLDQIQEFISQYLSQFLMQKFKNDQKQILQNSEFQKYYNRYLTNDRMYILELYLNDLLIPNKEFQIDDVLFDVLINNEMYVQQIFSDLYINSFNFYHYFLVDWKQQLYLHDNNSFINQLISKFLYSYYLSEYAKHCARQQILFNILNNPTPDEQVAIEIKKAIDDFVSHKNTPLRKLVIVTEDNKRYKVWNTMYSTGFKITTKSQFIHYTQIKKIIFNRKILYEKR